MTSRSFISPRFFSIHSIFFKRFEVNWKSFEMKNICVGTLFLLCIVPVLLWPMEESLHPLPASLAEEGFEVAGRHPRAVRSTPATATTTSRKTTTKNPVIPTQRKGSSTSTHHTGPTLTPAHPSQPKATKKAKLNRPTKPGKKYTPRHHQQKKHKKLTDTKVKQSDKPNSKPHLKNEKPKNNGAIH